MGIKNDGNLFYLPQQRVYFSLRILATNLADGVKTLKRVNLLFCPQTGRKQSFKLPILGYSRHFVKCYHVENVRSTLRSIYSTFLKLNSRILTWCLLGIFNSSGTYRARGLHYLEALLSQGSSILYQPCMR